MKCTATPGLDDCSARAAIGAADSRFPSVGLAAFDRARLLHTLLRVRNLDAALHFHVDLLGMRLLRRQEVLEGRYTLAFVGCGDEAAHAVLELTHNWDARDYELGSAYGHIAVGVDDVAQAVGALALAGVRVTRRPAPLKGVPGGEVIAFVEDADGYRVELVQRG